MTFDQLVGGLVEVSGPEGVVGDLLGRDRMTVGVPGHAGVVEAAESAEEAVVGDAEDLHRLVELAATVIAQAALLLEGQVRQRRDEHLAHLTRGAGDEGDADALVDVAGHGGAGADALVVGVGVDEQDAAVGHVSSA